MQRVVDQCMCSFVYNCETSIENLDFVYLVEMLLFNKQK